jgi:hypothetical protein
MLNLSGIHFSMAWWDNVRLTLTEPVPRTLTKISDKPRYQLEKFLAIIAM